MLSKDELYDFNKRMAEKISYSMQKSLAENGSIPANTGKNILKDYIYRMLQYYSEISSYDICGTNRTGLIRKKEIEIEFETYVTQPEIWEEWKSTWDLKKPLHDSGWLKMVEREEEQQYNEKDL